MTLYRTFANEMYSEYERGIMTADNVLEKTLRLQQLTGGFFVPDKSEQPKMIHAEKLDMLMDVVEGVPNEPVVVFARFTDEIKLIRDRLAAISTVGILSGNFNDLKAWQDGELQYLIVQINTGAEAISLVRARYFIYYSNVQTPTR